MINTVIAVCVSVITVSIVVFVVYLVLAISQVRRVVRQVESMLESLNKQIGMISKFTEDVSYFFKSINSPWGRVGAIVTGIVTGLWEKRKNKSGNMHTGDTGEKK